MRVRIWELDRLGLARPNQKGWAHGVYPSQKRCCANAHHRPAWHVRPPSLGAIIPPLHGFGALAVCALTLGCIHLDPA
jgi:hypothetical protein